MKLRRAAGGVKSVACGCNHARADFIILLPAARLFAVLTALIPRGKKARLHQGPLNKWVRPLLEQLEAGQGARLLDDLRAALPGLPAAARAQLERQIGYFENHRARLDYPDGKRRGEPLGSGSMESTCHQYQCRFKRAGQFWTQVGDEALMCVDVRLDMRLS